MWGKIRKYYFPRTHTYIQMHRNTHTHTHSLTHSHSLSHSLTHTHTLSLSHTHTHTHTLTLTYLLTHSLTHTHTHTHTLRVQMLMSSLQPFESNPHYLIAEIATIGDAELDACGTLHLCLFPTPHTSVSYRCCCRHCYF